MKTIHEKPKPMTLDELSRFVEKSLNDLECKFIEFRTRESMTVDGDQKELKNRD